MEWTSTNLRVLCAVAESGSFTAAASALGYTQSAVSRQIAALERAAGAKLFDRRRGGIAPTAAGAALLRHAGAALEELDRADRAIHGVQRLEASARLGFFASAGGALVPEALSLLRERRPEVEVLTREASTPALVRSLRAATLDLVLIAARPPYPPPDQEEPSLALEVLVEGEMLVAVPKHWGVGDDGSITLDELASVTWISGTQTPNESVFGAWPALPQRSRVRHRARDWQTRLALVAAGHGALTLPPILIAVLPPGVRALRVADGPEVQGRVLMARRQDDDSATTGELVACLREAAASLPLG